MAKPPLGSGARFSALKSKLAGQKGVTNPGALAASIGRKKLGKSKFQSLAAKGKKVASPKAAPAKVSKAQHLHIHIHNPAPQQDPSMVMADQMGQRFQSRIQQPQMSHYGGM